MKGADRGQDIQDQSAFQWPKLQPHPPVLRRPGDISWTDHHSLSSPPPLSLWWTNQCLPYFSAQPTLQASQTQMNPDYAHSLGSDLTTVGGSMLQKSLCALSWLACHLQPQQQLTPSNGHLSDYVQRTHHHHHQGCPWLSCPDSPVQECPFKYLVSTDSCLCPGY